jgi:hypothetical protein
METRMTREVVALGPADDMTIIIPRDAVNDADAAVPKRRHCEHSEAIQNLSAVPDWIASSLRSSQ